MERDENFYVKTLIWPYVWKAKSHCTAVLLLNTSLFDLQAEVAEKFTFLRKKNWICRQDIFLLVPVGFYILIICSNWLVN
jgi:hypothetical protein